MDQTFSLDELYNQPVDPATVREANQFRTIPTGNYTLQADKVEGRIAGDKSPWPGRKMLHVQASVADREGGKKGKLFFDMSHEEARRDSGKLDTASTLWGQLVKALDMAEKSVGEVVDAFQRYPVRGFVLEAFKKPEGGYVYPKSQQEADEAAKEGYAPVNFVQNLGRIPG